jgi:hypothetical protein
MKAIVITTIYPPTPAIDAFAKMEGYRLYVVGDRKTPGDWTLPDVSFISATYQEQMPFRLISHLPWNHYCRKMIGYLQAIADNADCIVDTDDDNIPKPGWGFPEFNSDYRKLYRSSGFVNIYKLFTDQDIWPRGLPLNLISTAEDLEAAISKDRCKVGVWQGLADEDPDVDAVYRLTSNKPCFFDERDPVVLPKGVISPFNTQNTLFRKELFPLLYLPVTVTFRFTDILRGLVAQPVMWQSGYELGFTGATVIQKRNPHDYMKDFVSEMPMYFHSESVTELVSVALDPSDDVGGNLFRAYEALEKKGIVYSGELTALEAWLKDMSEMI